MKLLINYNFGESLYENSCDSCITLLSLHYFF